MGPPIVLHPATRALVFPPEIVHAIVVELGAIYVSDHSTRNAQLVRVALVARDWAAASLSVLYSDLKIEWRGSVAGPLLAAAAERPQILEQVTRLAAFQPSFDSLARIEFENAHVDREDLLPGYAAYVAEVAARVPQPGALPSSPRTFDEWAEEEEWELARDEVERGPDGDWATVPLEWGDTNKGNLVFWEFVARLPRLRHLRICGFGRGETPNNLVAAAREVLFQLDSLDMCDGNDGPDAPTLFAGDLVHTATNIRHLATSGHHVQNLVLPSSPNILFPHLETIYVSHWSPYHDERARRDGTCTLLELAEACGRSLKSLVFNFKDSGAAGSDSTVDLVSIASTLRHLPHLRTLSLSPHRDLKHSSAAGPALYPVELLEALPLTKLYHFGINETPTKALLDALPTTIRSLSFVPALENNRRDAKTTDPSHDDLVQLLVAAKDRLGDLRHVSLARGMDFLRFFDDIPMATEPGELSHQEERIQEETRQLEREKEAALAGFKLQSRHLVRDGLYDTKYIIEYN